jgi:hypothetical protein
MSSTNATINTATSATNATGTGATGTSTSLPSVVFTKANYIFILWFLAIYVVAYYFVGFIFKKSSEGAGFPLRLSRGIDFIVLVGLLIYLFTSYFTNTEAARESTYDTITKGYSIFINEPTSIITIVFSIILFYVVLFLFNVPMSSDNKSVTVSIIEMLAWLTFVIICFVDFFKYALNLSLTNLMSSAFNINNLPSTAPITASIAVSTDISGNIRGNLSLSQPVQKDEVFNISNNLYTYDDAQAICSAYGSKIATYEQIEESYKDGAEWCNYGWSDNQMAFFPTQKATWDKLQKTKDRKNDCGRPGINGGYMANPYIKFGVNCYGKKPAPTDSDLARMSANKEINVPKSEADLLLDAKVQFWKDNASKMLVLNSFDRTKWSEY